MTGSPGAFEAGLASGDGPDAKVQAALRLVAAEQRAERTVLDLAGELGISLRALELHFYTFGGLCQTATWISEFAAKV